MADFAIYWKNYAADCLRYGFGAENPLADWRTNADWLAEQLRPGDRLWFFTPGEACDAAVPTAAYLVNMFRVRDVTANAGDDPDYPPSEFRYTICSERSSCLWVQPPALADRFVRAAGHSVEEHIGPLFRGPRRLEDDAVRELEALVG